MLLLIKKFKRKMQRTDKRQHSMWEIGIKKPRRLFDT